MKYAADATKVSMLLQFSSLASKKCCLLWNTRRTLKVFSLRMTKAPFPKIPNMENARERIPKANCIWIRIWKQLRIKKSSWKNVISFGTFQQPLHESVLYKSVLKVIDLKRKEKKGPQLNVLLQRCLFEQSRISIVFPMCCTWRESCSCERTLWHCVNMSNKNCLEVHILP